MADGSNEKTFYKVNAGRRELTGAIDDFVSAFGSHLPETFALLYAPGACLLARIEVVPGGEKGRVRITAYTNHKVEDIDVKAKAVYEARVFNSQAELRWLNEGDGIGRAVVLCDSQERKYFDAVPEVAAGCECRPAGSLDQGYLLWGTSTGKADTANPWSQFAEARVGAFYVPIGGVTVGQERAQFTATEYLCEYADGNVKVMDERLTGLKLV